jgi:hypothetical protein
MQTQLGGQMADISGYRHIEGMTLGEVVKGLWPISGNVASVAFHPAGKEGTYTPYMLTPGGLIYKTQNSAFEEFAKGQMGTTGSSGALAAILSQPYKYSGDVARMGLVAMTPETAKSLAASGAVPTTITEKGAVYSSTQYAEPYRNFQAGAATARTNVDTLLTEAGQKGWYTPSAGIVLPQTSEAQDFATRYNIAVQAQQDVYTKALAGGVIVQQDIAHGAGYIPGAGQVRTGYDVVGGRGIAESGVIAGAEGIASPVLAAPYIAGIRPVTVTPEAPQGPPSTERAQSNLGLLGIDITSPVPTRENTMFNVEGKTMAGAELMAQGWTITHGTTGYATVPPALLAGTPLAPVGAAYMGAGKWWEETNKALTQYTSRLPKIPAGAEEMWGSVYRGSQLMTPVGFGYGATEMITGKKNPVTEAQIAYFPQQYKGIREEPLKIGVMLGVGAVVGGASDFVGTGAYEGMAAYSPRLASAISKETTALGLLYGTSVGIRVATAPSQGTELAHITATEVVPGLAGVGLYHGIKGVAASLSPFPTTEVGSVPRAPGYAEQLQYFTEGREMPLTKLMIYRTGPSPLETTLGGIEGKVGGFVRSFVPTGVTPGAVPSFTVAPGEGSLVDVGTPTYDLLDVQYGAPRSVGTQPRLTMAQEEAAIIQARTEFAQSPAGQKLWQQQVGYTTAERAIIERTVAQSQSYVDSLAPGKGVPGMRPWDVWGPSPAPLAEGPWPGVGIPTGAGTVAVGAYEVPLLAQEIAVASPKLSPQVPAQTESLLLGFTPVTLGAGASLRTDQRTALVQDTGSLSAQDQRIANLIGLDPITGAVQVQAQGQTQAVSQGVRSDFSQISGQHLVSLPATAQAKAAAQATKSMQVSGMALESDLGLIPAEMVAPVVVTVPALAMLTISMPTFGPPIETLPPTTPLPTTPGLPVLPGWPGGGGPGGFTPAGGRRYAHTFGRMGLDIATWGTGHVPELRGARPPRSFKAPKQPKFTKPKRKGGRKK